MDIEGLDDEQRFTEAMKSYTVEEFIADLGDTLIIPKPTSRVKISASDVIEIWDYQLKRKVHFL